MLNGILTEQHFGRYYFIWILSSAGFIVLAVWMLQSHFLVGLHTVSTTVRLDLIESFEKQIGMAYDFFCCVSFSMKTINIECE